MAWHPPQHGEAFARWRGERRELSGDLSGEALARAAWAGAVRAAVSLVGAADRTVREKLLELGAEAFEVWWKEEGSAVASSGELSMKAWDAAIRAGVVLLFDEKDRLIEEESYEAAAVMRDAARGWGGCSRRRISGIWGRRRLRCRWRGTSGF